MSSYLLHVAASPKPKIYEIFNDIKLKLKSAHVGCLGWINDQTLSTFLWIKGWHKSEVSPAGGVHLNTTHLSLHWWKPLWRIPPCGSLHPAGPQEPSPEPGWAVDTPGNSSCRYELPVGSAPRARRRGTHAASAKWHINKRVKIILI